MAESLHGTTRVPPDLRAALYRAVSLLPGLTVTDPGAELEGRRGTAIGLHWDGQLTEIVIDPVTGDFVGYRETSTEPQGGLPAGRCGRPPSSRTTSSTVHRQP